MVRRWWVESIRTFFGMRTVLTLPENEAMPARSGYSEELTTDSFVLIVVCFHEVHGASGKAKGASRRPKND